jgi:ankyrin repeat protein
MNTEGKMAIRHAAEHMYVEVVQLLLEMGANPRNVDVEGISF